MHAGKQRRVSCTSAAATSEVVATVLILLSLCHVALFKNRETFEVSIIAGRYTSITASYQAKG